MSLRGKTYAKIAMLGLTDKSSNATMVHVKVNVAGRKTTAPIDVCVSVTAKSLVRCVKHPAKFSADTPNDTKNAKNPVHRALKIAHGRARTVDTVRCLAPLQYNSMFRKMWRNAQLRLLVSIGIR